MEETTVDLAVVGGKIEAIAPLRCAVNSPNVMVFSRWPNWNVDRPSGEANGCFSLRAR